MTVRGRSSSNKVWLIKIQRRCRGLEKKEKFIGESQEGGITYLLCPLSESPSRKGEDLHDNAIRKGREIYCWFEPGPLLQPTQWCKVREPWAPVSTHIYRVLYFTHKQWVVGANGLVTCLQSNFIGTNFRARGTFQGTFSEVYWTGTD